VGFVVNDADLPLGDQPIELHDRERIGRMRPLVEPEVQLQQRPACIRANLPIGG
jgi:hypothetical protein